MESMESYTLSDSNESCDGFDGFTPHDITHAQNSIHLEKNNDDDFSTTSETLNADSERSISESNSEITSDDDIISSDVESVDNDLPSESENGENGEGNIPTDSDEADAHVDLIDTNNIIGCLGEGSNMMQILNMPIDWTQELKCIVMNPFT